MKKRAWWVSDSRLRDKIIKDLEEAHTLIYQADMYATSLSDVEKDISEAIRALRRVQDKIRREIS